MKKQNIKDYILDTVLVVIGTFVYAVGVTCFTAPHDIAPGGVTGIATMLNSLFGLHIGMMTLLINVPLLLLAWRFIGRTFFLKTLFAIGLFSIMADYVVVPFIPEYVGGDNARILASIFGGILSGVGIGLMFTRGFTSGGTDIVMTMLRKRFPHFSSGKMLFMVDLVVVAASVLVYGNIETALFALITMFAMSKTIDTIVYGGDKGRMVMIISDKYEEIVERILVELDRGATYLKAEGSYSREEKRVIMVAIRINQYHKLKRFVSQIDPRAFIVVCDTSETTGEGFKHISKE